MSFDIVKMEIQKRQTRIQSLSSELMRAQIELEEVYREEARTGMRLSPEVLEQQIRRGESEIRSLQREIEQLVQQAKESEESRTSELNPLEMLGLSAIMKADGKLSEEQFNQMLEQVRRTLGDT